MLNPSKVSNLSSPRLRADNSQVSNLTRDAVWRGKLLAAGGLIFIALCERLWWDLGANIELVTVTTLVSTFYLGKRWGMGVALITLAVSDMVLGNTAIALFTWSAYAAGALGFVKFRPLIKTVRSRVLTATFAGAGFGVWFYLWTNFGVWLTDTWGMYPHTLAGLITCYVNGLPFLKNQLLSNLIIIPSGFSVVEMVRKLTPEINFTHRKLALNLPYSLKLRNPV